MSVNIGLSGLEMERGTESIHACFPAEMEGDNCSPRDEVRESRKQARDSSISGCFGWVRKWICIKNDLDSDEDFYERKCPDNTGECTEDSRDSSTGGCFECIRKWVCEKFPRSLVKEQETLTAQRPVTPVAVTAERPVTATEQRPETPVTATEQLPVTVTAQRPVTATEQGPVTPVAVTAQRPVTPVAVTAQPPVTAIEQRPVTPVTATEQLPVTVTAQRPVTPVAVTAQRPMTATEQRPVTPVTATEQLPVTVTEQRRGEWNCVRDRNEGSHTATCSTGDHADYTLHEGEAQCSMLNREDAVEPDMMSAAETQGGAENSVSEGDENGQTLSLPAPELKEMDPQATEERPVNASAEQVQTELGVPKTDKQMKKLEKENRRLRKILKNLTEERGEQLDEEFEPPSMQDALCQKNYMRKVKKQSKKMEDRITSLRALSGASKDPNSTATCDGNSTATGESDSPATCDGDSTVTGKCDRLATGEGDSTATCDGDSTATGEGDSPATCDGDSTVTGKCDRLATGEGDSTATCDGDSTATD
ncbi:putative surface protein SACOL0050 [Cryptotermes secundus]|uniref:putative surface protein SACOL0050 n=1 Tax=Cryptotermes secundus TaxID=105785 RepID=UPI001454CF02|nr:putative surface protein SACOL0050 [Cryptotermes secundus]